MGLVVALAPHAEEDRDRFLACVEELGERIARVRPTAVNLSWAIGRLRRVARETEGNARAVLGALRREATRILDEDREMCRRIGEHGASACSPDGARVLTHCNAGALATAGIGTALAPVYIAAERGGAWPCSPTRRGPLMQGSRLTAWELAQAGIDVTVLADNMAASLMREGRSTS
jgi:methylthioribose-1-phosphate isomerase